MALRRHEGFRAPRRQRGLVLVLYVLSLVAVVGMMGFALDLGNGYLNKTRLQNALDAAALEAAKVLFDTASTSQATAAANDSLSTNGFAGLAPGFTYTGSSYVQLDVANYPVQTYLSQAIGVGSLSISASAKAGVLPLGGSVCGAPLGICAQVPGSGDQDCSDGNGCYGLTSGELALKGEAIGPGNYGLLNMGSGASGVNDGLAGASDLCYTPGQSQSTQPGLQGSNKQALNSRFGQANGQYNDPQMYPSDVLTGTYANYAAYQSALASGSWNNPGGVPKRRTMLLPIMNCSSGGGGGGRGGGGPQGASSVAILGTACAFMTRSVGNDNIVYMQFIDRCQASGGTPGGGGTGGSSRIVLFQAGAQG